MTRKYTVLEMLFSNRSQLIRKLSKCYWVEGELGWVKFTKEEIEKLRKDLGADFSPGVPGYKCEDWTAL